MSVDIHALSGAYAVDAVDEFERAQFERHLSDCSSCRAEVDSLREAGSLIAETSSQDAPASLRSSVLSGIQSVRPLPPAFVAAAERGRSTRRRFPALVAAAAALIVIGGAGATMWHPWADDAAPAITQAQRVQDAADAQTVTYPLRHGGSVTLVRSETLNQAVVSADGLAALPDDQTYNLWLIHDDNYVSAGLMDGDASSVLLDGDPASATGFGITVEPSGGSESPDFRKVEVSKQFETA